MLPQAAASGGQDEPIQPEVAALCVCTFRRSHTPVLWGGDLLRFFGRHKKSPRNSWGKSSPTLGKSKSFSGLQNRAEQDDKNTSPQPPNQAHKLMCSANLNKSSSVAPARECLALTQL